MKRLLAILMGVTMLFTPVTGCSSTTSPDTTTSGATGSQQTEGDTFSVVATNFATYDWAKTVIGEEDNVKLTYLLESGVDSHSYQPSADDIIEIANCDLFLYVGGESDTWVDGVLAQAVNQDMIVLNLMEVLGDDALAEETVEGMEVSDDHDHEDEDDHDHEDEDDHDHEDEDDHDHEDEDDHDHEECEDEDCDHDHSDEHIWLSLRNATTLTVAISEALAEMNPDAAAVYTTNSDNYLAELVDLDRSYTAATVNATNKTILVADRFPFLYLVSDYDLDYYAAFNGCSAETEASFETIAFLAGKVDELGINTIFTIEGVQHKIAETVSAATQSKDQQILVIDSMQNTTADDIAAGATYLNIMAENLNVLKQALGE